MDEEIEWCDVECTVGIRTRYSWYTNKELTTSSADPKVCVCLLVWHVETYILCIFNMGLHCIHNGICLFFKVINKR